MHAREVLPVLGEPATAAEPSESSLDDPAFGQDDEAFDLIRTFDDFEVHPSQTFLQRFLEFAPLIASVGIELQEERKHSKQRRHQKRPAVAILNIGGVDESVHQQALRIDENMSLLAPDLLAGVEARRINRSAPFSALFTLWLSIIAAVGLVSRKAASRHLA